jgi:hypothetical protein
LCAPAALIAWDAAVREDLGLKMEP